MQIVRWATIVIGLALIAFPLGVFALAWALGGYAAAVAWATSWIVMGLIIFTVVPLAILGALTVKGMPWITDKVDALLRLVSSAADGGADASQSLGRRAIAPDLWLYTKAAWLRGFLGALRRP